MKHAGPDEKLLKWLHSRAGEDWSARTFHPVKFRDGGWFGSVKGELKCDPCTPYCVDDGETHAGTVASKDYEKYGLYRIPEHRYLE